jgi:hypothetical protein
MTLLGVASIVLFMNIPFGFWRGLVRKFSWQWILAIHLPVPIIIFLRFYSGLGWQLISFPILIGAFFIGQYAGSRFAGYLRSRREIQA